MKPSSRKTTNRRLPRRPALRPCALAFGCLGLLLATAATANASDRQIVPGEVVVSYTDAPKHSATTVPVAPGESVHSTLHELRSDPDVRWADPNPVATIAGRVHGLPDDPGRAGKPAGWQEDQWNFLRPPKAGVQCTEEAPCGVNAPKAWRLLRKSGHPYGRRGNGKRGPIIAVVDTGVAYRDKGKRFRRSPDLGRHTFVPGRDFVDGDHVPLDRNGHGTHVASTIAEKTGNGRYVTGLADGLRIMPVRVLSASGAGSASDVAHGIRFATRKGAKVINLSLEFSASYDDCKGLRVVCKAISAARRKGVFVVGAAGNAGLGHAQMPARAAYAVAAGTIRGCLSRFSSRGADVDLTAPGGGVDAPGGGSQCVVHAPGPVIAQLTLREKGRGFRHFGYPRYEGTSMAAPHVSAAAGLVLSSRFLKRKLGHRPTPREMARWLGCTARAPFDPAKAGLYGDGLLDLAAAVDRHSRCPELGI